MIRPLLTAALAISTLAPALRAQDGVTVDTTVPAATANAETPAQRDARLAWWREAKFGLFIHWGSYSAYAGEYKDRKTYGEWIMNSAKIPVAEYRAHAVNFNPVSYDPVAWVRAAKAAGEHVILEGHEQRDARGVAQQQGAVERLHEARVDHAHGEVLLRRQTVGEGEGVRDHRAQRPDHNIGALPQDFGLADRQQCGRRLDRLTRTGAAGVAEARRTRQVEARVQHIDELILVLRLHNRQVRHAAQVRQVE